METLFLFAMTVFAEAEAGEGDGGGGLGMMLPLIAMIIALYYFVVIRGNKRDRETRESILSSLKKNDRVLTIGGIIGTVASTSADGKEVTLKIDDNTRMKVLRSAIQGPLKEAKEQDEQSGGARKDFADAEK